MVVVVEEGEEEGEEEGQRLHRGREVALVVEVVVDVARRSSRGRKPPRQRSRKSPTFFPVEGRRRRNEGEVGWKPCVYIYIYRQEEVEIP